MKISEKIRSLFGPLDIIILTKEFEQLIKKDAAPDITDECVDYARKVLTIGKFCDRNPTWWKTFQGTKIDTNSEEWRIGIANILRLSTTHEINPVDNNYDHLKLTIELELLAINAGELTEETFIGAKCITAKTKFGIFPVVAD